MTTESKQYEKKKWVCSQCEVEIEYNTRFYERAKEILAERNDPTKKEWSDLNKLEKTDVRSTLEEEGLFPTMIAEDGRAHLCEVKSLREEIEALKLKYKKQTGDIATLKEQVADLQKRMA